MSLGSKIGEYGDRNYKSKAEFARALDIHRERLYPIIRGEVIPSADLIKKLYDLGCPLDWLFSDEKGNKKQLKTDSNRKQAQIELAELKSEAQSFLKRIKNLEKLI